jgi:hypothetical protein
MKAQGASTERQKAATLRFLTRRMDFSRHPARMCSLRPNQAFLTSPSKCSFKSIVNPAISHTQEHWTDPDQPE